MTDNQVLTAMGTGTYLLVQLGVIARAILRPHREPASRVAWVVVIVVVPVVGIVACTARHIYHPPGGFQRDAVGIVEVHRPHDVVVDGLGDLAAGRQQSGTQRFERVFVGHVEAEVVELDDT